MKMKFVNRTWLGFLAIGALVQALGADEMTAYQLIKEGNRYVGEECKDKVVQIRSERSVAGLTPIIWYIVWPCVTVRRRMPGATKLFESPPMKLAVLN